MKRNIKRIPTASRLAEHLFMATRIMSIPPSIEGCVIECGTYMGGSAANLSIVCAMCNRQLHIFDSFQGLPEPADFDRAHHLVDQRTVHTYERGSWSGSLDRVKSNIARYGAIDACTFTAGYFDATLPQFKKKCAFVFVDVDLVSSLETCLRFLWPLLEDGCPLFTHEAPHQEISSLFFDREWWQKNLGLLPPGLIGAGSGLGLIPEQGLFRSDLGYTVKKPDTLGQRVVPQPGLSSAL